MRDFVFDNCQNLSSRMGGESIGGVFQVLCDCVGMQRIYTISVHRTDYRNVMILGSCFKVRISKQLNRQYGRT